MNKQEKVKVSEGRQGRWMLQILKRNLKKKVVS